MQDASKIEQIRRHIEQDFGVARTDQDYLLHYVQVNLVEVRKQAEVSFEKQDWQELEHCAAFLQSVGCNFDLDDLRQAGVHLASAVEQQDLQTVGRLLLKLDLIMAEILG